MSNAKKAALALGLCIGLTGLSFGDTFYSLALGYYRLNDQFPEEDFGRGQNGACFNFSFYYFPDNPLPLGLLIKTSIGAFGSGYEWKGDDQLRSLDGSTGTVALRFSFAPSYDLKLGSKVHIPISIGPSFGFYWENTGYYANWVYDESFYYEAVNFGIMGDVALIFIPSRRFFLKQGLSVEWDFFHAERGEMKSAYRTFRSGRFKGAQYMALGISVYFGVGLRFQ